MGVTWFQWKAGGPMLGPMGRWMTGEKVLGAQKIDGGEYGISY